MFGTQAVSGGALFPDRGPGWWSISELAGVRESARLRRIGVLWLGLIAACLATGFLNVELAWNAIRVEILGLPFDLTISPPFLFSVLAALWLGPTWGALPIYLANFASALASGLSLPMSALFAVAGVIETLMLWSSLVALRVDPDLRRLRDIGWFLAAGLVAAVTGSLAAILWNSSHGLDPVAGQQIWRGWVIGDLAQLVVLVMPLLYFAGPRMRGWIDRQFVTPPLHEFSYTHGVALTVVAFAVLGLVVFLGVHQALGTIEVALDARTASGALLLPRLREIVLVMGLLSTALIVATGMFSTALARLGERQRREALQDSLTGCANRRAFADVFHKEAERSRRLGLGLGVLFLDLDHFKALNDRFGHAVGDAVLGRFARRVEGCLRESDVLFRWGGEEFVVLVPHAAAGEVKGVAERIRASTGGTPLLGLPGGTEITVTVSVGAATAERRDVDPQDLVERADRACYEAKSLGRDRVVMAA